MNPSEDTQGGFLVPKQFAAMVLREVNRKWIRSLDDRIVRWMLGLLESMVIFFEMRWIDLKDFLRKRKQYSQPLTPDSFIPFAEHLCSLTQQKGESVEGAETEPSHHRPEGQERQTSHGG